MGLENLKSVFEEQLNERIEDFSSNIIISRNGTQLFDSPPQPTQFIATNPTDFSTAVGNNELPFTPLNLPFDPQGITGGKSFLDGLSWDKLYNSDHTPLDEPGHKGLVPISYPNVNRDKLDIRSSNKDANLFSFSRSPFLGLGEGEPYIVSKIGSVIQNAGSREVPIIRGITDAIRLGKFTSSPAGLQFIARQNLLGLVSKSEYPMHDDNNNIVGIGKSPQRHNTFYNPLSSIGAAAARLTGTTPNFKIRKGFPKSGDKHTLLDFGVSDTELSERLGRTQYKENIEDAHPNDSDNGIIEGSENGMPFYFKDLRDGAFIFFRAYIEGLTENISPSYAPHNYIGRSEPVWTYERAEREISMTLKLVAQTSDELEMIYKKMDRLTSLCYPEYVEDTYGNRMKPPLTKFRYGELFGKTNKEQLGYIKSISYSVEESSPYETDPEVGRVPRHVNATIGYQVIHEKAPRLDKPGSPGTKFYGINQ